MRLSALPAIGLLSLTVFLAACDAATDRVAAEAYVRSHISELSPEPAVLGGTFFVTDIAWREDDTALVTYEDGHILLTARAEFAQGDDGVTVSSFAIVDDHGFESGGTSSERPRAAEGEFCGGIAGIECDFGLMCRLGGAYPDAGGTCVQ